MRSAAMQWQLMLRGFGLWLLLSPSLAGPAGLPDDQGAWQARSVRFDYLGYTAGAPYSCAGLHDTLSLLLGQLGAVRELKIATGNCIPNYGAPSRFPSVQLTFEAFVPVSASGVAVGGAPLRGHWRPVLFAPRHPVPLGNGDCELVDEFRLKGLPTLAVRALQSQLHCEPFQALSWNLALQVFAPLRPIRP